MVFQEDLVEVDLEKHPTAKALVERCKEFFAEVENLYEKASVSL
jgi:hypothetical protein